MKFYMTFLLALGSLCSASLAVPSTPGMVMLGIHDLPAAPERAKRKVSELDGSSGALEYMSKLRDRLTDGEGRPVFGREDDPTSVWCIKDRDMIHSAFRPRPEPPAKCSVQNTFIFNWETLASNSQQTKLPVQKAILRAYLKPISRLLKGTRSVQVDIDVRVGLLDETSQVDAGRLSVDVQSSSGWMELDVTRGVKQLLPPSSQHGNVEFTVILQVNCKNVKKVPAIFIDPTEIKLSQTKRRQRYSSFQPLFLVYFNDDKVKDLVRNETMPLDHPLDGYDNIDQAFSNQNNRRKRNSDIPCKAESFAVIFHELNLDYISIPFMYNARQCSGSCSHYVLTEKDQLGTNHAKIMASAYAVSKYDPTVAFRHKPKEPCCVPTRYSAMTLLVENQGVFKLVVYPAMKVEECGCR